MRRLSDQFGIGLRFELDPVVLLDDLFQLGDVVEGAIVNERNPVFLLINSMKS